MKPTNSRRNFLKKSALSGSAFLFAKNFNPLTASVSNIMPALDAASGSLAESGFLDITLAPYHADPNGLTDSTHAIQQAVNDARDKGLVCFFPSGTYIVSDTISCEQRVEKIDTPRNVDGGTQHYWPVYQPMVLKGSIVGKRPVIKLAENASGFDDPENPKRVFYIWAQTWFDAPGKQEPVWGREQGNISFNHFFVDIDIDIRGHAGAIGIRHTGSQGSAMYNSTIYAAGAYAGMNNCCGQGGGTYNFEVIGGDYGIMIDPACRFPILTSCSFKGQNKSAVGFTGSGTILPALFVGCLFQPEGEYLADMSANLSYEGLTLIDCLIEMREGGKLAKTNKNENIFVESTFSLGVSWLFPNGPEILKSNTWQLIERFSSHSERGIHMVNGEERPSHLLIVGEASKPPEYSLLHKKHFGEVPSFEDPDAVNVKTFGAKGDGTADDTEAFRKAIAASDLVFVPKGNFRISGKLELGSNTKIFGITRSFSSITTGGQGRRMTGDIDSSMLGDNQPEPGAILLPDNKDASPGLYLLSLRGLNIEWKSGKAVWMLTSGTPKFSGYGGGKFYGFGAMGQPYILDGVTQDTRFYAMNVERVIMNPQSEIRNSKNIYIYYFKVESGTIQPGSDLIGQDANTPCKVSHSENINIYCMYGNVKNLGDRPMLDLVNSRNILVSQLKAFQPNFPHIRELLDDRTIELGPEKIVSLFVRD